MTIKLMKNMWVRMYSDIMRFNDGLIKKYKH